MPHAPEDITGQQDDLLAMVSGWPDGGTYRLYTDDPAEGGAELATADGYASVSAASVTWTVDSGQPSVSAELSWTATDEWDDVAEWWAYHNTDGTLRFSMPLTEAFDVQAAGVNATTITAWFEQDYEED
jgi:hypothetical protein